jgi:hypothetical protein
MKKLNVKLNKKEGITTIEIMLLLTIFLVFTSLFCFFKEKATETKLYNENFGKHYTVWDFIWAGDTIKEFLNGGKQTTNNLNINGTIPVRIEQ